MSSMNMRELPLWLKRCLIFETIAKVFEIPIDVGEKVLRNLSSREQKNSHMMITELKDEIGKYERNEHIKWWKHDTKSVSFEDPFYDPEIGRGALFVPGTYPYPSPDHSGFCPKVFCESFLPCGGSWCGGFKTYEVLMGNELGEKIVNSGQRIYNLNIGRFLSLSRCHLDLAHPQMKTFLAGGTPLCDILDIDVSVSEFYEYVEPPIRASYASMTIKQRREQFYQHSDEFAELVEEEAEYYIYLMKSSLLKVLPLKEIVLTPK